PNGPAARSTRLDSTSDAIGVPTRSTASTSIVSDSRARHRTTREPTAPAAPVTTTRIMTVAIRSRRRGVLSRARTYHAGMGGNLPAEGAPCGGIPFLGELRKELQGQASGGAEAARQVARTIANEGEAEANIDPQGRMAVEALVRVAELQIQSAT